MSKELDDAYFRSTPCTHHEPLLSKLVDCVNLLEDRIKGLLGATVSVGETETLPAGSEATAKATKRGYDTVLDFGIPRGADATATDVRINGTSITADGVADIPISDGTTAGVIITDNSDGGYSTGLASVNNRLYLKNAAPIEITNRYSRIPILANNMDYAVKASMCDGKGASWTADEQKAARERMNAADANKVYIMQKQIENLQGIAATEETDSTEAYTKTVPTGAQKWASLDKVGGKTVVWNQGELMSAEVVEVESRGKNLLFAPTSENTIVGSYSSPGDGLAVNKVYVGISVDGYVRGGNITDFGFAGGNVSFKTLSGSYGIGYTMSAENLKGKSLVISHASNGGSVRITYYDASWNVIGYSQTIAYGSAFSIPNDAEYIAIILFANVTNALYTTEKVQLELGAAATAYAPYRGVIETLPIPQSVRDMCPGYGWSAGTVCNEIDFGRKVYVQRVGSVDLGTLGWSYDNECFQVRVYDLGWKNSYKAVCAMYQYMGAEPASSISDMQASCGSSGSYLLVKNSAYTDAVAFKQAMQGVLLYYELAEPIEVDLSNVLPDDHYIEVEAGGTVTFKQASTQLPVPSSVTYQMSTSEVIANA